MKLTILIISVFCAFVGGGLLMEWSGVEEHSAYSAFGYLLGIVYCMTLMHMEG